MGWRFRKSIKILPGVKLNLGAKSASISIGGFGVHRTYSTSGRVTNSVSIPGTGLYYTSSSSSSSRRGSSNRTYRAPQQAYNNYTAPATQPASAEPPVDVVAIRKSIEAIYRGADETVDWEEILLDDNLPPDDYFKMHANGILNGDIDTYYEVINDVNPLDDLITYGSEFECGTDDPRMLAVHFHVNSRQVLGEAKKLPSSEYHDLQQDYVCGCAIRIARDIFALLPVRHVVVDARDWLSDILSVDFTRKEFERLDFDNLDASDTVGQFNHRMSFSLQSGFKSITPIDDYR